jgi:hypothetical protein
MSSYYYDVLEPSVQQQGSHMVMKGVSKPLKEKIVNIDTKYRTDYDFNSYASANMVFGEKLSEVRSMEVVSIDIPMTFYNIFGNNDCVQTGNNYLRIKNGGTSKILTLTPNYYASSSVLVTEINTQLQNVSLAADISYSIVNNKSFFKSKTTIYSLATNVDACGNVYEMNNQNNLGWVLGFRDTSYNLTTAGLTSECNLNLRTPRHLFLALNEFSQGNSNSFVSPLEKTNQNKNIIAKICIPSSATFGDTLCVNKANGLLVSEVRKYLEKVNIQRMNLQLLDDAGRVVHLNGADFSVCLRLVHE